MRTVLINTIFISALVLISCGVTNVSEDKEELVLGQIDEDFIKGKNHYDSIIRSHIVFPSKMKIEKRTRLLYYELIIGTDGRVIKKKILTESEKEFSDEILRCLDFVEEGWQIKLNENNVKIPYRVRGKFYFELF